MGARVLGAALSCCLRSSVFQPPIHSSAGTVLRQVLIKLGGWDLSLSSCIQWAKILSDFVSLGCLTVMDPRTVV